MKLSHQAIEEFKRIYEEEHGKVLSDDEAQEIALRLLTLFRLLTEPPSLGSTVPKLPPPRLTTD